MQAMPVTGPEAPPPPTEPAALTGDRAAEASWHALLAQTSSEVAGPLTAALERVDQLTASGRIDRRSLQALRREIDVARRAAMIGQQLVRCASGRLRQSPEHVQLADLVHELALQRQLEWQRRGLALRQALVPAEVVCDAPLLFALIEALLDWALMHARGDTELRIDHLQRWPQHARLVCRIARSLPDETDAIVEPDLARTEPLYHETGLDTLSWRLVEQTALVMGLDIEREDSALDSCITIKFPRTVREAIHGVTALDLDEGDSAFAPSAGHARPLAGAHVLVIVARHGLRPLVEQALAPMGLRIDYVGSVDAAREVCRTGLPHGLVFEAALAGAELDALQQLVLARVNDIALVEIDGAGDAVQISAAEADAAIDGTVNARIARVGRDALSFGLPSALVFELSKNL